MAALISSSDTSGVRPALFMIKLAALITLKRCSHMLDNHELLSFTSNWSCSLSGCLLLEGWVEISSPTKKLVPQRLLLACELAITEYNAVSDASRSSLLLKKFSEVNCPLGSSVRKSLHETRHKPAKMNGNVFLIY